MSLLDLATSLGDQPAILAAIGRTHPVVAVPEPARAYALAAVAALGERRPVIVATPSGVEAERLERDLATLLGPDAVALFPAWETLPFERVSPGIETMGRRNRVLWSMDARPPAVIVAPVRALVQRLAPGSGGDPLVIGSGDVIDLDDVVEQLVLMGYRRDVQVEHRGDIAVRGSILDIYPSTADAPVRVDLWGDEVDRLSEFAVSDQRSTVSLAEVEVFACRELSPDGDVRALAEELIATEPWGREQWQRIADGELFDGMESWLPWLAERDEVFFDRVPGDALVVLVEPNRARDRAGDLLAEEADLAGSLSRTWGIEDTDREFPHLHVPFDRLLSTTDAPLISVTSIPENPDVPVLTASGWDPGSGRTGDPVAAVSDFLAEGYAVVVAADGQGSATRLQRLFDEAGLELPVTDEDDPGLLGPGARIVVAPLERGAVFPESSIAVVTEGELTGRRRSHRRQRARRRDAQGFFDDLKTGHYVVHRQHGVARYAGMVTRTIGGMERDYLLLEYRGGDKLYIPSDQIDTVRHYTG